MPSKTLHSIQIGALKVLEYRLRPQGHEWIEHMQQLANATEVFAPLWPPRDLEVVNDVLFRVADASITSPIKPVPRVKPLSAPRSRPSVDTKAAVSPPPAPMERTTARPPVARQETTSHKRKLPSPAEWSPETDPIVLKSRRTASAAIGAERAGSRAPPVSHWASLMPRTSTPYPSHLRMLSGPAPRKTETSRPSMDSSLPWMRNFAQRQSY
jgi:hypothetical protein